MKIIMKLTLLLVGIVSSFGENCDKHGILLYEDLGCTPNKPDSNSCPTKYTCPHLEPWTNNCYFKGKSYDDGEHVNETLLVPACDKGCHCVKDDLKARFICAILDCPEWIGPPVTPGCYRKYSMDACCTTGEICPPFDDIEKCVVDGKEYREGEKFTPANTCFHCVCQKGFQGKYEEPFCKRKTCGVQLRGSSSEYIQKRCSPIYNKKEENGVLCCPYNGWICPDGSEEIKGEVKSDETCYYAGDKSLKIGQKFEKLDITNSYGRKFSKVECECVLPPLLTCHEVE